MIGRVPSVRPVITVLHWDSRRKLIVQLCDREKLIEAIAKHLQRNFSWDRKSVPQMYA